MGTEDSPYGWLQMFYILLMVQKSQTITWDVSNFANNGIRYQPQLVQDFFQQYVQLVFTASRTTEMVLRQQSGKKKTNLCQYPKMAENSTTE